MLLTAAVTAQLADLVTYVMAITRFPGGEGNPVMAILHPSEAVVLKTVGIVVVVLILWGFRARTRLFVAMCTIPMAMGALGAGTNLVYGVWR